MCKLKLILVVVLVSLSFSVVAQAYTLPEFIEKLFEENALEYVPIRHDEYLAFCTDRWINFADTSNMRSYYFIQFVHELMTGSSATDCAVGGILRIPYFWHWVNPNPRYSIVRLPDSISLADVDPPAQAGQYKSLADIDRTPVIYLSDLVTVQPGYSHPGCGDFHTFGWCSEREMAFCTLMKTLGYRCKTTQSGIHTWSEVLLTFMDFDSNKVCLQCQVDNTFNMIGWKLVPDSALADWEQEVGDRTQIEWYNRVIRSDSELQSVRDIVVSDSAAFRIRRAIARYFFRD